MGARIDYGQDAPGLMRGFFAGAFAAAALAAGAFWLGHGGWDAALAGLAGLVTLYLGGMGAFMIWESRIGKVRDRDHLLDARLWRGDEEVLDLGCGRGLMLIGAALRAPHGRAVGLDLWRSVDQSGNDPAATLSNAERAGVADRVEVMTADMTRLPLAEDRFDLILSAWAVHNLPTEADRRRALTEMLRVLQPGGSLLLTDIEGRKTYPRWLAEAGAEDIRIEILHPVKHAVMAALSFGSFAPFALHARKGFGP